MQEALFKRSSVWDSTTKKGWRLRATISMEGASAAVRTTCPTHTEIIECFGSSYISVADVYSAAPDNLVAQHAQPASSGTGDGSHGGPYYFFSPVYHLSATN